MSDYYFDGDVVKAGGQYGTVVAVFEPGGEIRDKPYGKVIGFVGNDGTVKSSSYGNTLGFVTSDGVVKSGSSYGPKIGQVGTPHHRRGALLLILG